MSNGVSANWKTWNIPQLTKKLREGYDTEGLSDAWSAEEESITSRLESLRRRLSGRYKCPEKLGIGGSGLVLKLLDDQLSDQPVALKFPRPVQGQMDAIAELLNKEVSHLVTLRHASIVRLHGCGTSMEGKGKFAPFPYFVMDFVDGAKSHKYLESTELDDRGFYEFLNKTVDALAYLHSRLTLQPRCETRQHLGYQSRRTDYRRPGNGEATERLS